MRSRQKQVIEAYQRVQDFLKAHPVPPPAGYGWPKQLMDDVVARLTGHSTDQMVGGRLSRAETQKQRSLRKALRELHLRPIAQIAKAVLRDVPGIEKALRIPALQLTAMRLIAEASAIRDAVAPYESEFVKNGRPAGFLAELDAAIEAVQQSRMGRARSIGTRVGARAGLAQEIRRGRAAMEMLDAIVSTTYFGNQELLAKWRVAKRVQAVPGGGSGGPAATGGTADENDGASAAA